MKKKILFTALMVFILSALFVPSNALAAEKIVGNTKAKVDVGNVTDGYVRVAYVGGGTSKIKVLIKDGNQTQYTYNLNNTGDYEVFPLSEGDSKYTIGVYTNTKGTSYATTYTTSVNVKLKNQFSPFLMSNQYVKYEDKSATIAKAAELTADTTDDLKKVELIYNFVVQTFTYDKQKAATVKSGYLPDIDTILSTKKGICFDYASVMTAMLRSQKIPCKLVVGYAGEAYHAWINVYTEETGWINSLIQFDGQTWKLMDPTFASSGNQSSTVMKYIGDGSNYAAKYYY
jgi:hypothetical protein